jgi:hypothetical protein
MIRWLWDKMLKWGWDYNRDLREDDDFPKLRHRPSRRRDEIVTLDDSDSGIDMHNPISFRVEAVTGGTLVETRWYNSKTDNNERKLHIVGPEENLSEAIGKIVTMELLKR